MNKTSADFQTYFSQQYGERWPNLQQALASQRKIVVSLGCDNFDFKIDGLKIILSEVDGHYQLDLASVIAVLMLPALQGQRLLDLCCAPGGKSLSAVMRLCGVGHFVMNDLSESRLVRTKRVMKEFSSVYGTDHLQFFKRDASRWGLHEPGSYDQVLCDVPCSGEGHGAAQVQGEGKWSLKTAKSLSRRQIAIACSGFDSLKSGGVLLYSTCSINPLENDGVVERLLKKRADQAHLEGDSLAKLRQALQSAAKTEVAKRLVENLSVENTEFGCQLFPDLSGTGPIYFSLINKL
jgi:16S rRNA C967 or C1407 C5-methylase (RsmB/RsmF family)